MSSYSSERHEEQRFSSSSGAVLVGASAGVGAYVLPEATMVGTSTDVVPGAAFYRHQSAYKTEKADGLGRTSRVEAVSIIDQTTNSYRYPPPLTSLVVIKRLRLPLIVIMGVRSKSVDQKLIHT